MADRVGVELEGEEGVPVSVAAGAQWCGVDFAAVKVSEDPPCLLLARAWVSLRFW